MMKFLITCLFLSTAVMGESLVKQENIYETELKNAVDADSFAKASFNLSQVRVQLSKQEMEKMPNMLGRDRSIIHASFTENLTYRQVASTFEKEPGNNALAVTYKMSNFMGLFCVLLGFFVMANRLQFRY